MEGLRRTAGGRQVGGILPDRHQVGAVPEGLLRGLDGQEGRRKADADHGDGPLGKGIGRAVHADPAGSDLVQGIDGA